MRSCFLGTCFLTAALVGSGCAADDLALDDEATDPDEQALRRGSFSFADPAVGRLVVGGAGCTATLINPQVLVTAAHCVGYRTGAATGTFTIHLSSTSSRTYSVSEVKSYGSGVGNDDAAIVRLTGAVPASVAVPLEISCAAVISNHERVTMYGYGCRSTQGDSYAGRKQRYDTDFDQTIYACPGDSGGPLIKTLGNR